MTHGPVKRVWPLNYAKANSIPLIERRALFGMIRTRGYFEMAEDVCACRPDSFHPPTLIRVNLAEHPKERDVAKLVICSRCHRNILEDELATHILAHKGKIRRFPSTTIGSPQSTTSGTTSFEEFTREIFASRPQKSNLSTDRIRDVFSQILVGMGLPISSLKVNVKRGIQAEVLFDEKRNVELSYDDNYLRTLSEDEIRASLSHEACHIATLPHSGVIVLGTTGSVQLADSLQSMQVSFIELYDEFLAHWDFARRFRGSATFDLYDRLKNRDFRNYSIILNSARTGLIDPANALFTILNDAIYFPVIGDSRFLKWCKSNTVEKASDFLDWLLDDFRFIECLNLERANTMRVVLQEGVLSVGVDPWTLLTEDKIVFASSAPEAESMLSQENKDLAGRWQERRLAISSSQG